jgi:DNA modification methylase
MDSVLHGDNMAVMATMPDNTFDTVITDAPYGLRFMGKKWDYDIPSVAQFAEILRVAKPGAYLLCFAGTRTQHRMGCNIEDAGWLIVDCVMWLYGSGFPKALDISKMIDKSKGLAREVVGKRNPFIDGGKRRTADKDSGIDFVSEKYLENGMVSITAPASPEAVLWNGWKTALKPAYEPIIIAMKPLDGTYANNAMKWGVAGFWIEGGRVEYQGQADLDSIGWSKDKATGKRQGDGWGTKDIGAVHHPELGRFPANIIHDGSDEVVREFPMTGKAGNTKPSDMTGGSSVFGIGQIKVNPKIAGDNGGSAARFFYCAKASKAEREMGCEGLEEITPADKTGRVEGSKGLAGSEVYGNAANPYANGGGKTRNPHPTVKPLSLMRYLVKLTKTPTGGVVLDPFAGSGTTGMACKMEGRNFVLIEQDEHYCEIAKRRIAACESEGEKLF